MEKNNYHKKNLKQAILSVTIQTIKKEGYELVSIRKIANTLNVSPTAIYRHYDHLENLFDNALMILSKEIMHYIQSDSFDNEETIKRNSIKLMGQQFVDYALTHQNEFTFLFLSPYSLKNVVLTNDFSKTPLLTFMKDLIEKDLNECNLPNDIDTIFYQLWSFIFGYAILVSKNQLAIDKRLIDLTVDQLLN